MNKSLIFGVIEVSKKEFYDSKKAIKLNFVDINNIVASNKVIGNNETSKYFIGYLGDIDSMVPLCIILPQMSGCIKYFENGGTNMSFKIEDDEVYLKYSQIWNKVKELLGVKFYNESICDDKNIKTKVKTFTIVVNALFSGNEIPKERVEYACIACINVHSVLKVVKISYPQVYLEQCKYKIMKREPKNFTDYETELDSDYASD